MAWLGPTNRSITNPAAAPTKAPIGVDLDSISYFSTQLALIDLARAGGAASGTGNAPNNNWLTHNSGGSETNEEKLLNLRSDGYPVQWPQPGLTAVGLQFFTVFSLPTVAGASFPYESANTQYTILWDGTGSVMGQGDLGGTQTFNSSGSTFNVATPGSNGGLWFTLLSSSVGDPLHNLRIVPTYLLGSFNSGEIWHPGFLAKMANIAGARFMDWQGTNNSCMQIHLTSNPVLGQTSGTGSNFQWGAADNTGLWIGPTGTFAGIFADGTQRTVTLTNNSAAVSWTGGGLPANISDTRLLLHMFTWANRITTATAHWQGADARGIPIEALCALAVKLNLKAVHFCVPIGYTDSEMTQMFTLIKSLLPAGVRVYLELANETWNFQFVQAPWCQFMGRAVFNTGNDFENNRVWFGMRTAQMADIAQTVWGANFGDAYPTLGAQAATTFSATEPLATPGWAQGPASSHPIKAIAIAPYFPGNSGSDLSAGDANRIKAQADGGLDYLRQLFSSNTVTGGSSPGAFTSVPSGGWLGQVQGWIQSYLNIMPNYPNMKLITYEEGQSLDGAFPTASPLGTTLVVNANHQVWMHDVYLSFMNWWKTHVGSGLDNIQNMFVLCANNTLGRFNWGMWDGTQQPTASAPPKAKALLEYIG